MITRQLGQEIKNLTLQGSSQKEIIKQLNLRAYTKDQPMHTSVLSRWLISRGFRRKKPPTAKQKKTNFQSPIATNPKLVDQMTEIITSNLSAQMKEQVIQLMIKR